MNIYMCCFIAKIRCIREYALFSSPCFNGRNTHFCREIDYVTNTHFFGLDWTQIWLRQMRFDSDLTQISELKMTGKVSVQDLDWSWLGPNLIFWIWVRVWRIYLNIRIYWSRIYIGHSFVSICSHEYIRTFVSPCVRV